MEVESNFRCQCQEFLPKPLDFLVKVGEIFVRHLLLIRFYDYLDIIGFLAGQVQLDLIENAANGMHLNFGSLLVTVLISLCLLCSLHPFSYQSFISL